MIEYTVHVCAYINTVLYVKILVIHSSPGITLFSFFTLQKSKQRTAAGIRKYSTSISERHLCLFFLTLRRKARNVIATVLPT
jgi:hypothetical protein